MSKSDQAQLYMLKGVISELPAENQAKIKAHIEQFGQLVKSDPENACVALGYIGLDLQVNPTNYGLPE